MQIVTHNILFKPWNITTICLNCTSSLLTTLQSVSWLGSLKRFEESPPLVNLTQETLKPIVDMIRLVVQLFGNVCRQRRNVKRPFTPRLVLSLEKNEMTSGWRHSPQRFPKGRILVNSISYKTWMRPYLWGTDRWRAQPPWYSNRGMCRL